MTSCKTDTKWSITALESVFFLYSYISSLEVAFLIPPAIIRPIQLSPYPAEKKKFEVPLLFKFFFRWLLSILDFRELARSKEKLVLTIRKMQSIGNLSELKYRCIAKILKQKYLMRIEMNHPHITVFTVYQTARLVMTGYPLFWVPNLLRGHPIIT